MFNHPGHPYQGGLYHAAARSSGFTFYESVFFDALGSLTWELFGETDIPALNGGNDNFQGIKQAI